MKSLFIFSASILLLLNPSHSLHAQFDGFANHGLVGVGRLPADSFDTLGPNIDTLGGIFSSMTFDPASWAQDYRFDANGNVTFSPGADSLLHSKWGNLQFAAKLFSTDN